MRRKRRSLVKHQCADCGEHSAERQDAARAPMIGGEPGGYLHCYIAVETDQIKGGAEAPNGAGEHKRWMTSGHGETVVHKTLWHSYCEAMSSRGTVPHAVR
jgi:hypothetical protein